MRARSNEFRNCKYENEYPRRAHKPPPSPVQVQNIQHLDRSAENLRAQLEEIESKKRDLLHHLAHTEADLTVERKQCFYVQFKNNETAGDIYTDKQDPYLSIEEAVKGAEELNAIGDASNYEIKDYTGEVFFSSLRG